MELHRPVHTEPGDSVIFEHLNDADGMMHLDPCPPPNGSDRNLSILELDLASSSYLVHTYQHEQYQHATCLPNH
jgi:hypothetical protein